MRRNAFRIVLVAGVIAVAAWQLSSPGAPDGPAIAAPVHGTEAVTAARAAAPASVAPATEAGFVVHVDANGKIVEEPVAGSSKPNAAVGAMINTSSEGLVEVPSPVAGGGSMMDLQGRFQSAATAAYDASGKLVVPCLANEHELEAFTSTTATTAAAKKE